MISAVICPRFCFVVISGIVTDGSNEISPHPLNALGSFNIQVCFNPNPDIDGQVVDVLTFEQAYKGRTSVSEVLCRIEVRIGFCDSDLVRSEDRVRQYLVRA